MGKQICFFATDQDWYNIFEAIYNRGGYIIDKCCRALSIYDIKNIASTPPAYNYYIVSDNWKIDCSAGVVAPLTSELIELSFCKPIPKTIIDLSPVDILFRKEEYTVIEKSATYHNLLDEYMRNPIYISNPQYIENGYEHGRLWCPTSYYDNSGNIIYQNKNVIKEYNTISRIIKKASMISEDRLFYIMPDAYKKYKKNTFIPQSGSHSIVF